MSPHLISSTKPVLPEHIANVVDGYEWTRNTVGESGGTVYRLQAPGRPSLYLKYGTGGVAGDISDEMLRLTWLGQQARAPEVVHFTRHLDQAWLLMSEIPGITAYQWLERYPQQRRLIVKALAAFLRQLHDIPAERCPFNSSSALRLAQAHENMEAGDVDESDFDEQRQGMTAQAVWDDMLALLPSLQEAAVVTHGDYSLDNLLIENGRVVGCIDCGRLGLADRYQDLAILWNCLGEFGSDLQELLPQAYGVELDNRRLQFHLCLDEFF